MVGRGLATLALCLTLPAGALCEGATATVTRGALVKTVYGSGTVEAARQTGVYAGTDATVSERLAGVGDRVKAGDVLAILGNDDLDAEIAQLEYDLATAQDAVYDVETYNQFEYRLIYDDGEPRVDPQTGEPYLARYSNELSIRSPGAGRVMAVYIEPGDDALAVYREHGAVVLLSTDGRMKVELEGLSGDELALGERVTVSFADERVEGTVVETKRQGTQATVQIVGDEYEMGVRAVVEDAEGQTVGEGTLEINKPLAVSAYGGTIKGVAVKVGDVLKREDVIARFIWAEMPLYLENAESLIDYAKAKTALEAARKKRDALTVVAPCDGVVAQAEAEKGDSVADGDLLFSLLPDGAGMRVVLKVDELDILAVEPGQKVTLTADALPQETFDGTVQKIAPLGNTGTGVTTYDVTVAVDALDARVLSGMNVSGEIAVAEEADALLVPTDALFKDGDGYAVRLEDGSVRAVKTGLMTDSLTQIAEGLAQGEIVSY